MKRTFACVSYAVVRPTCLTCTSSERRSFRGIHLRFARAVRSVPRRRRPTRLGTASLSRNSPPPSRRMSRHRKRLKQRPNHEPHSDDSRFSDADLSRPPLASGSAPRGFAFLFSARRRGTPPAHALQQILHAAVFQARRVQPRPGRLRLPASYGFDFSNVTRRRPQRVLSIWRSAPPT